MIRRTAANAALGFVTLYLGGRSATEGAAAFLLQHPPQLRSSRYDDNPQFFQWSTSKTLLWSTPTSEENSNNNARGYGITDPDKSLSSVVTNDPARSAVFSIVLAIVCGVAGPLLQSFRFASGMGTLGPPTAAVETWQWWPIPELYGITGLLVGWIYIIMDNVVLDTDVEDRSPDVEQVLFGFGLFLSQYLLAGALYSYGFDEVTIFAWSMFLAGFGFSALDGTGASIGLAACLLGLGPWRRKY